MTHPAVHPDAGRPGLPFDLAKAAALVIGAAPVGLLALFAFGEAAAGNVSGLGHLLQAVPLVILLVLAWWRPFVGGLALVAVAVGLAAVYLVVLGGPLSMKLVATVLFFGPPVVGGALFIRSSRTSAG